jgi:hypothetical protein
VRGDDRLEVLEARGGIELIEHELLEFSPARGSADQVQFFGLPGRAAGRGQDPVEHHSVHDVAGCRDGEALPHCPQRDLVDHRRV